MTYLKTFLLLKKKLSVVVIKVKGFFFIKRKVYKLNLSYYIIKAKMAQFPGDWWVLSIRILSAWPLQQFANSFLAMRAEIEMVSLICVVSTLFHLVLHLPKCWSICIFFLICPVWSLKTLSLYLVDLHIYLIIFLE